MRARDLGSMGEVRAAWSLLRLANRAARGGDAGMYLIGMSARVFGWRVTGRLSRFIVALTHKG